MEFLEGPPQWLLIAIVVVAVFGLGLIVIDALRRRPPR